MWSLSQGPKKYTRTIVIHRMPCDPRDYRNPSDIDIPVVSGDNREPSDVEITVVPEDNRDTRDHKDITP